MLKGIFRLRLEKHEGILAEELIATEGGHRKAHFHLL